MLGRLRLAWIGNALSMDLRSRALTAVHEGVSWRAAARFGVAGATVIRWHDQRRSTGGHAAKVHGGDTRSRRIEANRDVILTLHAERRGRTRVGIRRGITDIRLADTGEIKSVALSEPNRFIYRFRKENSKASMLDMLPVWFRSASRQVTEESENLTGFNVDAVWSAKTLVLMTLAGFAFAWWRGRDLERDAPLVAFDWTGAFDWTLRQARLEQDAAHVPPAIEGLLQRMPKPQSAA